MKAEEFLVKKKKDAVATPIELEVAKACSEIVESSSGQESRAATSHLRIEKVKEVDVEAIGKKVSPSEVFQFIQHRSGKDESPASGFLLIKATKVQHRSVLYQNSAASQ